MSRTKRALGKKNRILAAETIKEIFSTVIVAEMFKHAKQKEFISQENNQCNFKDICESNIIKNNHNDICFQPLYCLNKFDGKCKLIIKRIIEK
jgi:hypothetical protein